MKLQYPRPNSSNRNLARLAGISVPAAAMLLLALTPACGGKSKGTAPDLAKAEGRRQPSGSSDTLPAFKYMVNNLTIRVGGGLTMPGPSDPRFQGAVFSIDPPLPHGLDLIAATGAFSGSPIEASPATVYTVTATRGKATSTATLTLTVKPGIELGEPS